MTWTKWLIVCSVGLCFQQVLGQQGMNFEIIFDSEGAKTADSFQMPVGPPNGKGYYNAQGFGKNDHLGDDWNGVGGGNSDLGDPIYPIGNGYVGQAYDAGPGWGNVVRVVHRLADGSFVESLYAHLDTIHVKKGQWIGIGAQIGTIGNADGAYWAHLHLEIRSKPKMPLGGGYSLNQDGYLDPTSFIDAHQ
jgi:murein DD-endopeptidase MepM/ murein hydrolase activator NlpD